MEIYLSNLQKSKLAGLGIKQKKEKQMYEIFIMIASFWLLASLIGSVLCLGEFIIKYRRNLNKKEVCKCLQ